MKNKIFVASYIFLILIMFGLPLFSAEGYSIILHTTSQLGAQNTPNAWIMNFTFVLMGVMSIYVGWSYYEKYWLHRILLLCFGISLVFAAIYSHAPIDTSLSFSMQEDELHSLFATTTGFSFTLLAILTGLLKKGWAAVSIPIIIGIFATLLSLLMFSLDQFTGIWQRILFIMSFGWMILEFSGDFVTRGNKGEKKN